MIFVETFEVLTRLLRFLPLLLKFTPVPHFPTSLMRILPQKGLGLKMESLSPTREHLHVGTCPSFGKVLSMHRTSWSPRGSCKQPKRRDNPKEKPLPPPPYSITSPTFPEWENFLIGHSPMLKKTMSSDVLSELNPTGFAVVCAIIFNHNASLSRQA